MSTILTPEEEEELAYWELWTAWKRIYGDIDFHDFTGWIDKVSHELKEKKEDAES